MADEDQGLLGKYLPNALGLLGGAGAAKAMMMFPARKPGITAWHASPHKFDKFDLSKIGTGQGSQSYGYGIYSAENPKVAGLGGAYDQEFTFNKLGNNHWWGPSNEDILQQLRLGKNENEVLQSLSDWRQNYNPTNPTGNDARLLDKIRAINAAKAHVYQVGINAEPHQFLDWDQPILKQSPHVLNSLDQSKSPWIKNWRSDPVAYPNKSGEEAYRYISDRGGGDQLASETLKDLGIPGLKYLDQGSRWSIPQAEIDKKIAGHQADLEYVNKMLKAPDLHMSDRGVLLGQRMDAESAIEDLKNATPLEKGTRNYVTFDDKLMDIIKRYGIAAPMAGAGAVSALNSNQGQSQ